MSLLNRYSPRTRVAIIIAAVMILVPCIGLGARFIIPTDTPPVPETKASALVHQGDTIVLPEGSILRPRVEVQPVDIKNSPHTLLVPGVVEVDPARTVNILPPVTGRIVKLSAQLGDHVTKGQPLATIDSGDLAQAYADDDKARDALQHTADTLKRVQGLREAGAGSIKDLEQAQSDHAQAKAEFTRTEARLKEIGVSPQPQGASRLLTLTAPVTGSVIAFSTAQGAYINDVTATLMTIANLHSIWVTANVPESDIGYIVKGLPVDVSFFAYPGQFFHGTVAFVSDIMEPDTRRNKVRIAFANPDGRFKPNMFTNVRFNVPQESAVFVPNSALIMNNDSTIVYVEVQPWTFVKRPVTPGYGEGEGTRIDQGLEPGDRIVVKGGVLLND